MSENLVELTADIAAAFVSNNSVAISDVTLLISNVHATLKALSAETEAEAPPPVPAVSIRASIRPDYLVCLEDGKKLKLLRRHLMTRYGMTPDDYRTKWGLPSGYPMTAPNYSEKRRALAVELGLGKDGGRTRGAKGGRKTAAAKAPARKAAAGKTASGRQSAAAK